MRFHHAFGYTGPDGRRNRVGLTPVTFERLTAKGIHASMTDPITRLAAMGGLYGNLPATDACLDDARARGADTVACLGDAIGCCGHSAEILERARDRFDVLVAGNLETEAHAGRDTCGCGYDDAEDERVSCLGFANALGGLDDADRAWLGTWPVTVRLETAFGAVLLCHGSPARQNEFLYESTLDDTRIEAWLDANDVTGFVCTHSGLPWVRRLPRGRFAVNCGVVGKPDHDGDPAVHYALLSPGDDGPRIEIRRVAYDHLAWAALLEREGVDPVFVEPLRTGVWTSGAGSLPEAERRRPERRTVA